MADMSQPVDPKSALIGTWELLSVQFESADTGERQDLFGSTPHGRLVLTDAGDFMTVIVSGDRASMHDVARLFETMMAYAGKFDIDGDKIIISCDLSWHPSWVGTKQVRFFKLDDEKLHLRSSKQTHPRHPEKLGYGLIDWRREN
jgi:Lipocalin-like domain